MFFLLVATGIMTGLLSSFFGIGGGILAVPVLFWLFPTVPAQTIISSSLGMVFFNSIINIYNFFKTATFPSLKLSFFMSSAMTIGVMTGARQAGYLDQKTIKIVLAVVLFILCLKNLFLPVLKRDESHDKPFSFRRLIAIFLIALSGGYISGITGIGGGTILVASLVYILHMSTSQAPLYSNICMSAASFAGTVTYMLLPTDTVSFPHDFLRHFQVGYVNWGVSLLLSLGGLLSSQQGVRFHRKISTKTANRLFAILLLLISIRILFNTWQSF